MKFKIAALAAGVVLSGPSALAADLAPMPVEPAAPVMLPFDWSGFYVGVNAGYGLGGGDASIYTNGLPAPVNLPAGIPGDIGNLSTDGFLGGAQVGYDVQFGTWVVGIEGDIDYFNGEDEVSPDWALGSDRVEVEYNWLATVRARAGYAFENFLLYATGGIAFADIDASYKYERAAPLVGSGSWSDGTTAVGWTAGLGAEYAFTSNWSVKVEALYADFGSEDFEFSQSVVPIPGFPPLTGEGEVERDLTILRAGVNYRF
jgi:outer membrane immunogenic protein